MANPNKKKGKSEKKRGYSQEERSELIKLMKIEWPKMPEPLLYSCIDVEEKRVYGNNFERRVTQNILDSMPINISLDCFKRDPFDPKNPWGNIESKGMEIKENFKLEFSNLCCLDEDVKNYVY